MAFAAHDHTPATVGILSRLVAVWSRGRARCQASAAKLGFVKTDDDDLIDVGEDEDEQAWVPYREVSYRWSRNEQGKWGYSLWAIKPISSKDGGGDEFGFPDQPRKGGKGNEAWLN